MTRQTSDRKPTSIEAHHTQVLSKDVASFEHMYRHYQPMLASYLAQSTGNRELAEDLTQETFIKAWQVWSTGEKPKQIKAWLYSVAKHSTLAEYHQYTRNGQVTVCSL
jgi:RNA polymerase sigma-70 factor (ECF subfamily)